MVYLATSLFWLSLTGVAQAQEEVAPLAQEPQPQTAQPLVGRSRWVAETLRAPILGLARSAQGTALALTSEGAIYRKQAGGGWRLALAPPGASEEEDSFDEEALLLEAEALASDFAEEQESSSTEVVEEGETPAPVEVTGVDADAAELATAMARPERASLRPARGLWCTGEACMASRSNGLWWSEDEGLSWIAVSTLGPAFQVGELPAGRGLIAATAEGLRHSGNGGRSWLIIESPISDQEIFGFDHDGDFVYAGTSEGLFRSRDGQRWEAVAGLGLDGQPVLALLVDPDWSGGLWVVTPKGLMRSDDRGARFRPVGRNRLEGTRTLLPLPGPGHLLAVGEEGVWETVDGGLRWMPLVDGLPGPEQAAAVADSEGLTLAGAWGVWRLREGIADLAQAASEERILPLGELIEVALRQVGADTAPLRLQGAVVASTLAPRLQVGARLNQDRGAGSNVGAYTFDGDADNSWDAWLRLCIGRCDTIEFSSDEELISDGVGETESDFYVLDGEVYSEVDPGALASAGAQVAENIARYRHDLSQTLTVLYYSRLRLVADRDAVSRLPLADQVAHELEIQFVTARLDALTDGYFSRTIQVRGP